MSGIGLCLVILIYQHCSRVLKASFLMKFEILSTTVENRNTIQFVENFTC